MNSPATTGLKPDAAAVNCFHCGEAVPPDADFSVDIDGVSQPMCCPGCSAVARMIAGSGLAGFYRQRTAFNLRPDDSTPERDAFAIYDDPNLADTFTRAEDDGLRLASIWVGGITCAACTWLIEHALSALPGVTLAQVNLSQSRLSVRYDDNTIELSALFSRLDELGYQPLPYQESERQERERREYSRDLRRLGVAGLGMMQVGMFAIALHAGDIQGMEPRYQSLLRWVSLPVAAFVVLYAARPFFESAWRHLKVGALVMDLPVALAIGLAFLASCWATVSGGGQVYFDSVVMFTFFLLLGRFIEKRARRQGEPGWWQLHRQLPDAVTALRDGNWVSVPRLALARGERILVRAGDMVPADGRIAAGSSSIREDAFTGEAQPREVHRDDHIYAGTVNLEGNLEAVTTGDSRETRLAGLQRLLDSSLVQKPRLAKLADRVASWFIAAVLLVATLTGLWWLASAPDQALWVVLSVLVISCPCALALATPAALSSAASALQRAGILVRGDNALEALTQCTHLVFDKTGTLTRGQLVLARTLCLATVPEEEILAICAGLQQHSSHPMAQAFASLAPSAALQNIRHHIGAGMEAELAGVRYRMGSADFCRDIAPELGDAPDDELVWTALCSENAPLAWIGMRDEPRAEARQLIAEAKTQGLTVELLTGDSSGQGPRLARELGMSACRHGQSPQDKLSYISTLQAQGAIVCMVGDGINDGPVLSRADASFAVAGATDLARAQADFILLGGNLNCILQAVDIARRCRRVIKQNIGWALVYNVCAIPLAAAGLVPPWIAAIGMSASSLLVVANSLRLARVSAR